MLPPIEMLRWATLEDSPLPPCCDCTVKIDLKKEEGCLQCVDPLGTGFDTHPHEALTALP